MRSAPWSEPWSTVASWATALLLATPAAADTYSRQALDVLHYDVSVSFAPELASTA
jgi:hypothetical protein